MKKLRWGVIGAGGIADRRTIPGMMLAENAELIAVMDINAEQVEKIRQKYGAKRGYTKEEDLLADPEVDAVYIATSALLALGCHLCRSCHLGRCNWGIATQIPELTQRLNPDMGCQRLVNLITAWNHEIKEMMGGMGINSIEALRGNRLMLRAVGLTEKELSILGVAHAGE